MTKLYVQVHIICVCTCTCAHIVHVHTQAYVFMVGGGNYIEYQNLQDYCKRQQGAKKITYGTSELMNAQQFLAQVRCNMAPMGSKL